MDERPTRLMAVLIPLFLSTGVFLFTLAPSIYPGDSPEFTAAAHVLGIPHPPGYPHYVLLGKIWTLLPFGNVAFRLNLLSAIGTGLAAGAFSWLVLRLTGSLFTAVAGALLMAFSRDIWAQSGSAEVYTLNVLCTLLLLCLAAATAPPTPDVEQDPRKDRRNAARFRIAAFLFGYSLGIHYFVLFVLPGILFLFYRRMGRTGFLRAGGWGVPGLLAGWALFLVLPLRAAAHPPLNWGETSDPVNFLLHIGWSQYAGRPSLGFSLERVALRGRDLLLLIGSQWPLPLHLLLPAGLFFLWKRFRSDVLPAVLLVLLIPSLSTLLLLNDPGSEIFFGISSNKFLVPYALYALLLALGSWQALTWVVSFARIDPSASVRSRIFAAGGVALCLLVGWILQSNWRSADRSRSTILSAYTLNLLDPLPGGSGLAVEYDVPTFPLLYLRFVEEYRPDVELYGRSGILFRHDYNAAYAAKGDVAQERIRREVDETLILRYRGKMFFSNQTGPYAPGGDSPALPYGLVYLPLNSRTPLAIPNLWSGQFVTSPFQEEIRLLDHRSRELVSDMYRMAAEAEIHRGHLDNASRLLEEALAAAPDYYWIHYYAGVLRYRVWGDTAGAERQLERAGRIIPSEQVPGTIGILRFEAGDIPSATRYFRDSLAVNPDYVPSLINIAECYLASGRTGDAEDTLIKASTVDPGDVRIWLRLGQAQGAGSKFQDAVESFSRAIDIAPSDHPEAYFLRAVARRESGRKGEALIDLRKAVNLAPSNKTYERLLLRWNAEKD